MRVKEQGRLWRCIKRRELICFGHATRHDNHYKTILTRTLKSGRRHARQRKCWTDVTSKSGRPCHAGQKLLMMAFRRKGCKRICWITRHVSPTIRSVEGLTWPDQTMRRHFCVFIICPSVKRKGSFSMRRIFVVAIVHAQKLLSYLLNVRLRCSVLVNVYSSCFQVCRKDRSVYNNLKSLSPK